MAWQPIETAPKGKDIIIMMATNPNNPATWLWQQRARRTGRGFSRSCGYKGKPTHWQEASQ